MNKIKAIHEIVLHREACAVKLDNLNKALQASDAHEDAIASISVDSPYGYRATFNMRANRTLQIEVVKHMILLLEKEIARADNLIQHAEQALSAAFPDTEIEE